MTAVEAEIMSFNEARDATAERAHLCHAMKSLLVERLDLLVEPDWITDDQPLFGRGLELDSVDALEIAVGMEDFFAVTLTDDDVGVLGSVNAVADFIVEQGFAEAFLAARAADELE